MSILQYEDYQLKLKDNYNLFIQISQVLLELDSAIKYKHIGVCERYKLLNLIFYENESNISGLYILSNDLYLNKELKLKKSLIIHERITITLNNDIDTILSNIQDLLSKKLIIFKDNKFINNINLNIKHKDILYNNNLQINIPYYHHSTKNKPFSFYRKYEIVLKPYNILSNIITNRITNIKKINEEIFNNNIKRFIRLMDISMKFANRHSNIINIILEYLDNKKIFENNYNKITNFYGNNKNKIDNINIDFKKKLSEFILY